MVSSARFVKGGPVPAPKTLIIVKSYRHGNTAKVAEAMADVLEAKVLEADSVTSDNLEGYDLIGFGSGIYFGMMHRSLKRAIRELPAVESRPSAFVFSTSGLPFLSRLWHLPTKWRLRKKGFNVVGEFRSAGFDTVGPLALIGGINRGRPSERDLSRARDFARELRIRLGEAGCVSFRVTLMKACFLA